MLEIQLTAISLTFVCGLMLGLVFDVWRLCRRHFHSGRLATSVGDLLFWLVAIMATVTALLYANYGELRGWYIFSLALGFALYQDLLSPRIIGPLRRLLYFSFAWVKRVARWLGLPVWLPLKFIINKGVEGSHKGKKIGRVIVRTVKRKLEYWKKKKGP